MLGGSGLELIHVVALIREEGKVAGPGCAHDLEDKETTGKFALHRNAGKLDGHLAADFVKEALQIDVVLGLGRDIEIEAGFAGQADFLADEPVQIRPDLDLGR